MIAAFKSLSANLQTQIKDAVEDSTKDIELAAIRKVPAAGDPLKTTYGFQENNTGINQLIHSIFEDQGFTGLVYVDLSASKLAAYIEFKTGQAAGAYVPTLPPEWQQVARRYYVNGRGTLIGQPYLLPAFFEQSPKLMTKIVQILKKAKL